MIGEIPCVRVAPVVSITDESDADRIKVRLYPEDNSKTLADIDYAFPLLPKMFHVKPKVGEMVCVLLSTANDGDSQRYYLGPVISQDHRIYKDNFSMGADSFMRGSIKKLDVAPSMNPDYNGLLPNDEDIVIRGRKNADIQITDDDIRIKSGVKVLDEGNIYEMTYNSKNPTYGKFKYHTTPLNDGTQSTATIVGDKIMLLSPTSPNSFNVTDRKDLITDKELEKVIQSAYKLPYGEKLVEFLNIFVNAFMNHTHNFVSLPPNPAFTAELIGKKTILLDNGKLLSDTVRIN